jgi:hypothetical protein
MSYIDYLKSELEWCITQYGRHGYAGYMARAMALETRINEYHNSIILQFKAA